MAVLVSAGAVWVVLVRAVRAGYSYTIGREMGKNIGVYCWKTTGSMDWYIIKEASWVSSMVSITLVVSIGSVGPCVGPRLRKLFDGKPLV